MSTKRIILYAVFAIYQIGIFLFTLYTESKKDDLDFLFSVFNYISYFKFGALMGVVFLAIDIFWTRAASKKESSL